MNYAGKFDAATSLDGQGSHSAAQFDIDSYVAKSVAAKPFIAKGHGHLPDGAFVVPDANLIFHGDFKRAGLDLVLSHDGHEFVVHDYFKGDKRAALASSDGAHLTGDVVSALTGHLQVAQAAPGAGAAQVIGHVTKLAGSATAVRNGVSIVLNNGDNVEKGDVVATGGDSTLGITFIDGTVFGLSSNARMVLNEMVYDPNGSNNSSLLSLVAGTITFVAGETAKHGDMKIDTPVATMGIRGTAVLTQINFVVPAGGGDPQPQASFQVLVEPNGTTGSYILFDKVTLLPIATVNQAGQMIQISGGNVSITNALMSPDIQKLITDVFTLKFTDNNTNTKLTTNFTDTITPTSDGLLIKTQNGTSATLVFTNLNPQGSDNPGHDPSTSTRIPGPPQARSLDVNGNVKTAFALTERADTTGDTAHSDTVSGRITFVDQNLGDRPTVSISLADAPNYVYKNAGQQDVTASLTALQKLDIAATQIKINVAADGGNDNNGSAVWTYTIPDQVFDFLAAGETLTLTYMVRVDNNFSVNPEATFIPITITITGTNDKPVITTSVPVITFEGGTSVPGGPLTSEVPTSGTLSFKDVDLTDTHTVAVALTSATLPDGTVPPGPLAAFKSAMSVFIASGADSKGSGSGTINWKLADLPVYLADFIPKGEVLTLVYTVTLTDSQGATSLQTITVAITGTDAPAVVWIATDKPGSPSGGFWKDAANWETGTVPTIDDDVIVITDQLHGLTPSYPVTIDTAAYARSITMNDFGGPPPQVINKSTLTIARSLQMSADSIFNNFKNAQITIGGTVTITGTASFNNAGTLTLLGIPSETSVVESTIDTLTTVANSGLIELSAGGLTLHSDVNNAGGTVQVDFGAAMTLQGATITGGVVHNDGTLNLSGNAILKGGVLNNAAAAGTLLPVGAASSSVVVTMVLPFIPGLWVSSAGNVLENEAVTNSGSINISTNGVLTLDQGTSVANTGSIFVEIGGKLIIDHAGISGTGVLASYGALDLVGHAVLSDGSLWNNAAIAVSGAGNALDHEKVANAGTIEVLAGGALAIDQGSTVYNSAGSIVVDDGAVLTLNDATVSGGTINNYSLLGGTIDVTGDSRIDGHATLTKGSVTVDSNVTLTLDDATVAGAAITNHGAVRVDSGKKLTLAGAGLTGGVLVIAGSLESTGTSGIHSADVNNTGTISVTSGTLTIDPGTLHAITNHGLIEAATGGTLKLTSATIANAGGSISVGATSKLDLTDVTINGGSLSNGGNVYSAGLDKITGAVTNTGTIEVQGGTLNLAGGITGVGKLVIDDKATLELGGADAQTITFGGGANTLKLDHTSHAFSGTITGQSSTGGTFKVTGDANITTSKGDALDFTASGGTSGNHGNVVLTPTGALTGAANGIVVTQNGIGDVSLTTVGDVAGLNGNGIVLHDGATGAGDITATIGGGVSGTVGVDIVSHGAGGVIITNNGHVIGTTSIGIHVDQDDAGATGSTHITNTGSVVGAAGSAAISIQENATGTATIDNSGTIGPDDVGAVGATTSAIVETGGAITINNAGEINGNISVATATFNNESGGTWTVSGTSVFGALSTIDNAGAIDLRDGASISGADGPSFHIVNSGAIDSWGTTVITGAITNTGAIEVHDGELTLFGSLSGVGSVTVDAGALLKLEGTVAQTVALAGDGAGLEIDTATFDGAIAELSANDTIHLSTIKYGLGTSAVYVANGDPATGGVLTVTDADGHSISLTLTGADYSNATFAGSDDGAGHTLITMKAVDDAPAFTAAGATLTAGFSERANTSNDPAPDPTPAATGAIDFTDIDLTDRPTATITGQTVTSLAADGTTDVSASLTTGEIAALKAALTFGQSGKNNGTVTWSYSIADNALDFLAQDQTVKVVSTITLDDGHGQKATADVVVTITGTNDAPTLAAVTTDPLVDTGATDSFADVTGKLVGADVDHGETATLKYAALDATSHPVTTVAGQYGSLTVHEDGTYKYVPNAAAINALSAGDYADKFTVQTMDAHGATATATFTVNVTGANDAPTLDNATLASVAGDDPDPAGTAVSDVFAGKFHDVDAGAKLGAVAVTADNATADQGVWQYQVAGTGQWVDISGVGDGHALVLSPDTLIRFVATEGFSGTPGTLDVHALDDTYAGTVTANTPAFVDITATGIGHGGSTPVSDLPATIGTEVTPPANVEKAVVPILSFESNSGIALTDGAAIKTLVSSNAGDTVSFDWNFTTDDYLPYNDLAFATVDGKAFLLSDVEATGSFGASGWHTFTYVAPTGGTHMFGLSVVNDLDRLVTSFLVADNVRVNGQVIQSFESGFGSTATIGQVSIVASAHSDVNPAPILPTDGSHEVLLSSYDAQAASIEGFLEVSPGALGNVAQAQGPEHTPINVPLHVTVPAGAHPDDTYVTISGVPSGSAFNHGIYDGTTNSWHIEAADLDGSLTLTTPIGFAGSLTLTVTATSVVNASHTSATTAPQTYVVTVDPIASPKIDTTHFTVSGNQDGTTTVHGIAVTDADPAAPFETFTMSAVTHSGGTAVYPGAGTGGLSSINDELATGLTYSPGANAPAADMITLKVTDGFGAFDTVNFIFRNSSDQGPATLQGTSGKDVIFATGASDALTGGGGTDQFVFAPASSQAPVQHVVNDFETGLDKIDLRQFSGIGSMGDLGIAQQSDGALITLDGHETILLKSVVGANLHASDFIFGGSHIV